MGIALGLSSLAVTSDGDSIQPPRFPRSALRRIRRLSRDPSRKVKGSSNRAKARFRLAKAHGKVADQRLDHLHQLSTGLIRENQAVVVEDLNVSGMVKNRKLSGTPPGTSSPPGWRRGKTPVEPRVNPACWSLAVKQEPVLLKEGSDV